MVVNKGFTQHDSTTQSIWIGSITPVVNSSESVNDSTINRDNGSHESLSDSDRTFNYVMCSVSIAFLLLVILFARGLFLWNRRWQRRQVTGSSSLPVSADRHAWNNKTHPSASPPRTQQQINGDCASNPAPTKEMSASSKFSQPPKGDASRSTSLPTSGGHSHDDKSGTPALSSFPRPSSRNVANCSTSMTPLYMPNAIPEDTEDVERDPKVIHANIDDFLSRLESQLDFMKPVDDVRTVSDVKTSPRQTTFAH